MYRTVTAGTLMASIITVVLIDGRAAAQSRPAAPPPKDAILPPPVAQEARDAIQRGLDFLKASQEARGGWSTLLGGPAITAIAAQAFARAPEYGPQHAIVRRAAKSALAYAQPDGGIYQIGLNFANYHTSVVVMLLSTMNDPAMKDNLAKAVTFLRGLQYDEADKVEPSNPWYGGAGYTNSPPKRPDLSNTQMMIEALHQSGLPPTDPAYQKALKFISRCQMSGETNDQAFARGAADGGFIYSPAGGGESKAGEETADGRPQLRSYGSMTYAAFKSMLYANVDRNDPRVRTAQAWIKQHWTLDSNPNMPGKQSRQGLYYYFHVFAKAMRAWGEPVVIDGRGTPHNWRVELIRKLASLQNKDGSWVNPEDRWFEGDANYITAMSILALQDALETK